MTTKAEIIHIAERAVIHFFSSGGLMLGALIGVRLVSRLWSWFPSEPNPQLLVAAILVFAVAALREVYDVKRGQSLTKAIWDYVSWALGCSVSAWFLWLIIK